MENKAINSIRSIRRRLILTVVRAFAIVVILMVLSLLAITTYEINNKAKDNPFYRSPSTMLLEAFYIGNGSWANIDKLIYSSQSPDQQFPAQDWNDSLVLDQNNVVLIDHGHTDTPLVGQIYLPSQGQPVTPLEAKGQVIGSIVRDLKDLPHPLRLSISVIYPVAEVSLFLGLLAIVIGILLTRRVVNPIAEVIAAAEKVSHGDLSVRIKMKKGNDDLSALVEHFNDMTQALERNDNERRQLLADVAHELRTPLSVLRGRLEGIVDGVYPVNEANIAPVLEETYLLERLVDDLRLLTLAETRQLRFEPREVDLADLLVRIVAIFKPQAAEKGIDLRLQISPPLPTVWIDSQRLEQVIGNIIDNAMRYSNENGTVIVTADPAPEGALITIADNSAGVPEGEVERIFDRFWRSEKSRTRANGGAGLGLAIAKQLIEAQGGKIGAENQPTGGLKIWFILPKK